MTCDSILKKVDIIDKDNVFNKKNFRRWALVNHPDKGGDAGIFGIVSNCVDEYENPPRHRYDGPNPFASYRKASEIPSGFRPTSKKASEKKASTKKASEKKASTKKASEKKASTKKASEKKASAKKASAKKASEKKASEKKTSAKKASEKKASGEVPYGFKPTSKDAPKGPKVCPDGKVLNPKSNRCVDMDGKIGREILGKEKKHITCKEGKILNPKTRRCVDIKGKIGKSIVEEMRNR